MRRLPNFYGRAASPVPVCKLQMGAAVQWGMQATGQAGADDTEKLLFRIVSALFELPPRDRIGEIAWQGAGQNAVSVSPQKCRKIQNGKKTLDNFSDIWVI